MKYLPASHRKPPTVNIICKTEFSNYKGENEGDEKASDLSSLSKLIMI